jgi:hypothetical protein
LPSYTQLVNLTALSLADEGSLGLGFDPPHCSHVYQYPGVHERIQKEREEALIRLTEGVERILIQGRAKRGTCVLKQLTVGRGRWDYKTDYVTDKDGKLKKVAEL